VVTHPPRTHDLAKGRELADVVRIVVADDSNLAQQRVARRVRQDGEQIACWIAHDRDQRCEIRPEVPDCLIPFEARRPGIALGIAALTQRSTDA